MKALSILAVLQLLLLALLVVRSAATSAPIPAVPDSGVGRQEQAGLCLTDGIVRQILREELAALRAATPTRLVDISPGAMTRNAQDPAQTRQAESVSQQLEYFISAGSISEPDMAALQQDIARLDPAGRSEMLKKLVRAINSGLLDGQL